MSNYFICLFIYLQKKNIHCHAHNLWFLIALTLHVFALGEEALVPVAVSYETATSAVYWTRVKAHTVQFG